MLEKQYAWKPTKTVVSNERGGIYLACFLTFYTSAVNVPLWFFTFEHSCKQ
jgi:hypothetical protein